MNYGLRYDQFRRLRCREPDQPALNAVWTAGRYDDHPCRLLALLLAAADRVDRVEHGCRAVRQHDGGAAHHHRRHAESRARGLLRCRRQSEGLRRTLSIGLDSFYKASHNLIDEGQFGAPIILTPFNYLTGRQYGIEFTGTYDIGAFSAISTRPMNAPTGKDIVSSQFQFDPGDLSYIADHYIPLDHQQIVSISAGASYVWDSARASAPTCSTARACARMAQRRTATAFPATRRSMRASAGALRPGGGESDHRAVRRDQPVRREVRNPRRLGCRRRRAAMGARRGFFFGLARPTARAPFG
jgi:hypothetical protein